MSSEDPRASPEPVERVPALLEAGAARYAAREFWHAHEAWETAWHALRAGGQAQDAAWVRGMILVTAAFENATRGKEAGFKRQMAEGLHALVENREAGEHHVVDARAWVDALVHVYVDACRRRKWEHWRESAWTAPALRVRGPP